MLSQSLKPNGAILGGQTPVQSFPFVRVRPLLRPPLCQRHGSSITVLRPLKNAVPRLLPVQAAAGGRSGVSVYKAGRSAPLDSAQLDLSRLALPQLGSAGVEKCFETHVPSSGLKTPKHRKRPKMHFTNGIRALAANLLQNVVRQERTRIRVPSPSFSNAQKSKHRFFSTQRHRA